MTRPLDTFHRPGSSGLDDAVAALAGPVARRLTARYVPVYAAIAVMLLLAAVAPSRVDAGNQPATGGFVPPSELASAGGGETVGAPEDSTAVAVSPPVGPITIPTPSSTSTSPTGSGMAGPLPASDPGALAGADVSGGSSDSDPGGFADDPATDDAGGFSGSGSACPVEFGQDPEVSRDVASVLLGAASPALSLLGPFGPNAVPALGVASPLLPVLAPVVDVVGPYISLLNPLFLQVSKLGTALWDGPLQPLEGPLLELNAAVVQPLEVELLGALAGPLDRLNATPLTPCLQRLVYNLVAPLPIPTP